MFVEAIRMASAFTHPLVALRHYGDGSVRSSIAGFVSLGVDDWVLTSGHVIDDILSAHTAVREGPGGGPDAITACDEIWAVPGFALKRPRIVHARVNRTSDLALCRLEPFPAIPGARPRLRDTATAPVEQGLSACRLGFPFHGIAATFDAATKTFGIPSSAFPVPRFALDGIIARFNRHHAADGSTGLFIEMSSPGLRGQSGGPLVDVRGRIIGVQSHTTHLDLGFDPSYASSDGVVHVERQFLNVGSASHVDDVRAILDEEGVEYDLG